MPVNIKSLVARKESKKINDKNEIKPDRETRELRK